MPVEQTKRVRQSTLGIYADWVTFDPKERAKNPPPAYLLKEKKAFLESAIALDEQVKNLESQVTELKLQNQKLEMELGEASRKSYLIFALSLLATVMVGIGVNIATSAPNGWTGWVMIIAACILEGIAFFSRPQKGK
jgi:hypothetical protein